MAKTKHPNAVDVGVLLTRSLRVIEIKHPGAGRGVLFSKGNHEALSDAYLGCGR